MSTSPHAHDQSLASRLIELTRDLILIRSTPERPEERARCFEFIRIQLESVPRLSFQEFDQDGYASLLVAAEGDDAPDVLLCAHLDVVEHPKLDVYRSELRDGRIYGPGAGDMKGALAIMLELFHQQHTHNPGVSLGMAITSDEECGGEHGVRYLLDEHGLRGDQVIIPDGGSLNSLTIAEKGVLHVRLRGHGAESHAARPWLGDNALAKLLKGIAVVGEHFEKLRPADFAATNAQLAAGDENDGDGIDYWFPTCSPTILDTTNDTINRIPAVATAALDIRFPPPDTVQSMTTTLRNLIDDDVEIEVMVSAEPSQLTADEVFAQVTADVTGKPVRKQPSCGGSDARFFCRKGMSVNVSRPLVGNLHAQDEWIDVDSMVTYYQICDEYIRRKLLT